MNDSDDQSARLGNTVVRKLHAVMAALFDEGMTKSGAAVLACLAEHANHETGLAWPSIKRVADLTNLSKRQVNRALMELRDCGYVIVAEAGTRTRTTRHRLSYRGADDVAARFARRGLAEVASHEPPPADDGGDMQDTTSEGTEGGDPHDTTQPDGVVTSASQRSDTGVPTVVTQMAHEPTHRTRDRKGSGEVVGVGSGTGPGGPALAAPSADQIDSFWRVYPKGDKKSESERMLRALVAKGVQFSEILAGAERYGRYCRARHLDDMYVQFATNWLGNERWRDEFKLPDPKAPSSVRATSPKPEGQFGKKGKRSTSATKSAFAKASKPVASKPTPTAEEKAAAKERREKSAAERAENQRRRMLENAAAIERGKQRYKEMLARLGNVSPMDASMMLSDIARKASRKSGFDSAQSYAFGEMFYKGADFARRDEWGEGSWAKSVFSDDVMWRMLDEFLREHSG